MSTTATVAAPLAEGARVTYLSGYRMDVPRSGTVTRVGNGWVEVQRDEAPDSPAARLSVMGCQVRQV
jgi:hypothetical protein